jgi:hypothetical protein
MKKLSEEKIIEIINNNEDFIFKKFNLDDEFVIILEKNY